MPFKPSRLYGNIPIPFTIYWGEYPNGRPDFKHIDPERVRKCLDSRLCGICGAPYGRNSEIAYIGGHESQITDATCFFIDPPMHVECALFSVRACPFIVRRKQRSAEETPAHVAPDSGRYSVWVGKHVIRNPEMSLESRPTLFLRRIADDGEVTQLNVSVTQSETTKRLARR